MNIDFEEIKQILVYLACGGALVLVNTVFGALIADKKEQFDWKILLEGFIKWVIIFIGVTISLVASSIIPVIIIPEVIGEGGQVVQEAITLLTGLKLLFIALNASVGLEVYNKVKTLMDIKSESKVEKLEDLSLPEEAKEEVKI